MAAFEKAFEILIGHEGGYVNNPKDPGGETKFGISARAYPELDIKNLTIEQARFAYKQDYWTPCRCDEMPPSLALLVFDAAVNAGVKRSVKWLQAALGIPADGAIGPATMAALAAVLAKRGSAQVCRDVLVPRMQFYTGLPTWSVFGLGWTRRIMSLPFSAVAMEDTNEHRA